MGWFPESMAAQGRPDLAREVMLERRDAFLAAALSQLEAPWPFSMITKDLQSGQTIDPS